MNLRGLYSRLNVGRCTAILGWSLAVAYSLAPFDFRLGRPALVAGMLIREAGGDIELRGLALHFVAFFVVAAIYGLAFGRPTLRRRPALGLPWQIVLCVSIEAGQLLLPSRHASILDLVVNTLGVLLGHVCARAMLAGSSRGIDFPNVGTTRLRQLQRALFVLWAALWLLLLVLPPRLVSLDGWDRQFPLMVGNELGGDRPWAGEIQYVALYDRALDAGEIAELALLPRTAAAGPLLAYDFTQVTGGEVRPEGALAYPKIGIRQGSGAAWLDSQVGVRTDRATLVPAAPTTALVDRIASADAFSVEVRCRPANLTQTGPARIVSSSDGPSQRNFTLAQEGSAVVFRVRNSFTGPNGTRFELQAPDVFSGRSVHLVATYSEGVSTVFRDGAPLTPRIDLRWPSGLLGLGVTRTSHIVAGILAVLSLLPLVSRT